ncbi:hypothetical protein GCM10023221_22040 [Luteimicrobium xylanilyticum]|uniref:Asp23/Gls24 family envelope stress response protein n=2 Tax=Luteimicrobium xylanilyticum TaxID=1133546 RepID=A0A5P9Q643_9MICO|nr:hypothetical protein [Luteimicrobium xylanilyticum]QFU96863.1 hypothetical protein KDY119_00353 [Luteimicrobium xylanilyticum]
MTDDLLARAASTLRELTDDGWVRARPAVLERTLRVLRGSDSVVGRHADGEFRAATAVLVAEIRRAVDGLTTVRTQRVSCSLADGGTLEALAVEVSVAYGSSIAAVADDVRTAARRAASETLGVTLQPDQVVVDLVVDDVHRGPDTGA